MWSHALSLVMLAWAVVPPETALPSGSYRTKPTPGNASKACALDVRRVSGPTTLGPGASVEAIVAVTLSITTDLFSARPAIDRALEEFHWTAGPAELGSVEPRDGSVRLTQSSTAGQTGPGQAREGRFTIRYRAGPRGGIERLPLVVVNQVPGSTGADPNLPTPCTAWEGVLPFVIVGPSADVGDYLLEIFGTYQGEGSGGAASWTGTFSVADGDRLDGRGVRIQVDRGSCFRALVQEKFDIGGFVREDRFHFRLLNYRQERDDLQMAQRLECLVNALKEAGTLLLDVANRLDFEEVTLPVPDAGSREREHNGFTYRVQRLRL